MEEDQVQTRHQVLRLSGSWSTVVWETPLGMRKPLVSLEHTSRGPPRGKTVFPSSMVYGILSRI